MTQSTGTILRVYHQRMFAAIEKYEVEKQRFKDVSDAYDHSDIGHGVRVIDTENRKATDPRREKAAKDAAWAREEASMYAAAITAINTRRGD